MEARFSAPIQTGPGAHPASYIMGTGCFQGIKRPGCGIGYVGVCICVGMCVGCVGGCVWVRVYGVCVRVRVCARIRR